MRSLRVLFAVHGYKPAYRIGGPILSVSAVAERLVRRGHHVTVFTTNSNLDQDLDVPLDQAVDVDGVEVWYFRRQDPGKGMASLLPYVFRSMGFLYAPAMAAALDGLVPQVDLVHTHLPFIYPTYAAAHAAFRHRRPLFYHQRGVFDPNRLKFRALKKRLFLFAVERPILRRATTLFALTPAEVESYRALGVQTPCRVVPNGIDVALYRTEPGPAFDRSRIPDSATVVLFLGRLHPTKGADELLEAFLRVAGDRPDCVLVLGGPDEWNLEARFRDRIQSSRAAERVLFPGMVSGEAKLDLLARADLFCLPSDAEGFSMAVLEALSSATPVMISPGCHFPEVEAADAGRVVETAPGPMAAALSDLMSDRARLSVMGRRGRDLVARQYGWDAVVDAIEDAYREGIARSQAHA